ncbi:hypothetical protein BSKO_03927 [Bryopsis sp. KO-2023]|nr:hypothetical protein BSKO_03927 [Bryopsis sp. KO-2023]
MARLTKSSSLPVSHLDQLEEELDTRDVQLLSIQRNYEALSRFTQEKQTEIESLKTLLTSERNRNVDLSVRLDETRKRKSDAASHSAEAKKLRARCEELKKECDMSKVTAKIEVSARQHLEEKITRLSEQLRDSNATREGTSKDLWTSREMVEKQVATVRAKDEEIQSLNSDLNALKSQLHAEADGTKSLQRELSDQTRNLENARRGFRQKEEELKDAKKKTIDLQSSITDLEASFEAQRITLATVKEQERALQSQLSSTERSLALQTSEKTRLCQENSTLLSEAESLRKEINALQEKHLRMAEDAQISERHVQQTVEEKTAAGRALDNLMHTLTHTRNKLAETEASVHFLEEKLSVAEESNKRNCKKHCEEMKNLDIIVGALESRIADTAEGCAFAVEEIAVATARDHEDLQSQLEQCVFAIDGIDAKAVDVQRATKIWQESCLQKTQHISSRRESGLMLSIHKLKGDLRLEKERNAAMQMGSSTVKRAFDLKLATMKEECETQKKQQHESLMKKLAAVEEEMEGLKARWEDDRQSAKNLLAMEMAKARRDANEFQKEKSRLESSFESERDSMEKLLAKIRGQNIQDISTISDGFKKQLNANSIEAQVVDGHLETALGFVRSMSKDVETVVQHLKKMGITVKCSFEGMTVPDNLRREAKQLRSTVEKLVHVEESMCSNYTCMICLNVFQSPVTCVPCGHTYCERCLSTKQMECAECKSSGAVSVVPNLALDQLCSKYKYKKSTLQSIQNMCANMPC